MAENSTTLAWNVVGLTYGSGLLLGIILLILAVWLSSYFFLRSRHGVRLTNPIQAGANPTRGAAPQDGVVIEINEAAFDSSCPRMIYSEKSCQSLKSGDSDQEVEDMERSCSICLSDYKESKAVRAIPDCGHMFHGVCIDQWLGSHPTCPICRISPRNLPTHLPQRTPTPASSPIPGVTVQLISGNPLFSNMRL